MQMDNLSLFRQLEELGPWLEGAYVNKASELFRGVVKIKLHTKQGSKDLVICPDRLFMTKYSFPASQKKTTFVVALKKELYNKRIAGIGQHEMDRVVEIKFTGKKLVLEFIGDGNKILVGDDGKVIACERNEEWSDRKTRKGEPYSYPKLKGINPQKITAREIENLFRASERDCIRELISGVNLTPIIGQEALFRAGIEKSAPANSLKENPAKKLAEVLHEIYMPWTSELLPAFIYKDTVLPLRLLHSAEKPAEAPSINSCLDEEFAKAFSQPRPEAEQGAGAKPGARPGAGKKPGQKKDRQGSLDFMRLQQDESKKKFELFAQENSSKAELIYSHYNEIEELRKAVLEGASKGFGEKQITEKILSLAQGGNSAAKLLKKIDLKKREMELELE